MAHAPAPRPPGVARVARTPRGTWREPLLLEAGLAAALERCERRAEHERRIPQREVERTAEEPEPLAREELRVVEVREIVHGEHDRARSRAASRGRSHGSRRPARSHRSTRGPAEVVPRLVEGDPGQRRGAERESVAATARAAGARWRAATPTARPRVAPERPRELERRDRRPTRDPVPALLQGERNPHRLDSRSCVTGRFSLEQATTRADNRDRRPGRLPPRRAAARGGIRGLRRRPARARGVRR